MDRRPLLVGGPLHFALWSQNLAGTSAFDGHARDHGWLNLRPSFHTQHTFLMPYETLEGAAGSGALLLPGVAESWATCE